MGQGELGALGDYAKVDLDKRLAGILIARPAPAHRQPLRPDNLAIFAAAFMLDGSEHAEADPEAAASSGSPALLDSIRGVVALARLM
jgi:hypothetical protein